MFTTRKKRKQWWRDTRIIEMRLMGYVLTIIAYHFGLSREGVRHIIKRRSPNLLNRKHGHLSKKDNYGIELRKIVKEKRRTGMTYQCIACELNLSRQRIHQLNHTLYFGMSHFKVDNCSVHNKGIEH